VVGNRFISFYFGGLDQLITGTENNVPCSMSSSASLGSDPGERCPEGRALGASGPGPVASRWSPGCPTEAEFALGVCAGYSDPGKLPCAAAGPRKETGLAVL
jgi:hypothetical protein